MATSPTNNVCYPGSTIILNENTCIDTAFWEAIAPNLVKGYHNINCHTKATLEWQMIEIIGGFSAHDFSVKAMKE